MRGIEGQARRICQKIGNPDKFIEKTALNVEKLSSKTADSKSLEKAQRLLSAAQYSQGIAELKMQAQETSCKLFEELNKLK